MLDFQALPYLELFLGFQLAVTGLHLYLDLRQLQVLRSPSPPPVLAAHFNTDLYRKTQSYALDKWWLGLYQGLYSLAETLLAFHFRFLPWLWARSGLLVRGLPNLLAAWLQPKHAPGTTVGSRVELAQTVVFVLLLMAQTMVTGLPWTLYRTFVIEERHGFNRQTKMLFFTDMIKSVLLGLALMPPIVVTVTHLLHVGGPYLALYLWSFLLALSLFFMSVYPTLIAPLFNKYEPLPEGTLRTKIEQLASSLSFPLRKLFTVDGSKRSGHSNAYMYGFWKNKRIVLYDTLLCHCSDEQVVAVLAHELGHWKLRHTPVLFGVAQLVTLSNFLLFTMIRNSPALFNSFGFGHLGQPAFVALVLFQFISAPMDEVVGVLQNVVSRAFEFQADAFAVSQGHGKDLRMALLKLEEENKSAMCVDPLYSAYHYSHPPLAERLKAIDGLIAGKSKKAD